MTSKRLCVIGAAICFTGILGCCLLAGLNPARRSDQSIREELHNKTPLGSDEAFVDRYAKSQFAQDNFFNWRKTDSGKSLDVLYGCYQTWDHFPFATCVRIVWQFDEDHKLSEISVSRWVDSL